MGMMDDVSSYYSNNVHVRDIDELAGSTMKKVHRCFLARSLRQTPVKRRKADVLENWSSLTPRRWPWGFWFEVGWEVKQKRIRKRDFAKVRLVIRDKAKINRGPYNETARGSRCG